MISRSLRAGVSTAVDGEFVDILLDGVTPGTATTAVLTDLSTLWTAAAFTDGSRPFFLAAPDVAIRLATLTQPAPNAQSRLFPEVSPLGQSTLLGAPFLVSSGVAAATLVLADGSGIGAASDTVQIDISKHAALQLDDSPTQNTGASGAGSPGAPVATAGVSMWQTNSVSICAIAFFGAEKIRSGSVAAIDTIAW